MAAELGTRFKLGTALRQGMLPVVWGADDPLSVLEAYNALYLHEEVQMEGLVRNMGSFARFLQAMSFSHAGAWDAYGRFNGVDAQPTREYRGQRGIQKGASPAAIDRYHVSLINLAM
jgi:hypothetical protein